jgi:hypothetical protein
MYTKNKTSFYDKNSKHAGDMVFLIMSSATEYVEKNKDRILTDMQN